MKQKKELVEKYKKSIICANWYRQRFDACPQFLGMVAGAHFVKSSRKPVGTHFTDLLVVYNSGIADWYINLKDIKRISKIFIQRSKRGFDIGKKLIYKWGKDRNDFYQKCQEIEKLKISSLSSNDILEYYKQLKNIYQKWFSMSSIIDGFALGSDLYLRQKLDAFLKKKGFQRGRGNIFSLLTAPVNLSFIKERDVDLLKIVQRIKTLEKLVIAFKKLPVSRIRLKIKSKYSKIYNLLEQHQKQFFWIKNNYITWKVITIQEIIVEIKNLLNLDAEKQLKEIQFQSRNIRQKKQNFFRKYKPSKSLLNLIEISESFTMWQDERKKTTLFAIHYFSLLLKRLSQMSNYTLDDFKFFMPNEVISFLRNQSGYPSRKEIQKRKKYSLYYHRGVYYECFSGRDARYQFQKLMKKNRKVTIDDFRGITASPGVAVGRVKVVKSVQDINKIQEGDILVSIMTRPDYLLGIKKAIAIVTDEGGLTCHAAITSRELNIPCVIATKNATQILHDGDLVEVDANHGVIKIITRNEDKIKK